MREQSQEGRIGPPEGLQEQKDIFVPVSAVLEFIQGAPLLKHQKAGLLKSLGEEDGKNLEAISFSNLLHPIEDLLGIKKETITPDLTVHQRVSSIVLTIREKKERGGQFLEDLSQIEEALGIHEERTSNLTAEERTSNIIDTIEEKVEEATETQGKFLESLEGELGLGSLPSKKEPESEEDADKRRMDRIEKAIGELQEQISKNVELAVRAVLEGLLNTNYDSLTTMEKQKIVFELKRYGINIENFDPKKV